MICGNSASLEWIRTLINLISNCTCRKSQQSKLQWWAICHESEYLFVIELTERCCVVSYYKRKSLCLFRNIIYLKRSHPHLMPAGNTDMSAVTIYLCTRCSIIRIVIKPAHKLDCTSWVSKRIHMQCYDNAESSKSMMLDHVCLIIYVLIRYSTEHDNRISKIYVGSRLCKKIHDTLKARLIRCEMVEEKTTGTICSLTWLRTLQRCQALSLTKPTAPTDLIIRWTRDWLACKLLHL